MMAVAATAATAPDEGYSPTAPETLTEADAAQRPGCPICQAMAFANRPVSLFTEHQATRIADGLLDPTKPVPAMGGSGTTVQLENTKARDIASHSETER